MNGDDIIKLMTMIGIPVVTSVVSTMWLTNSKLVRMEAELQALKELSDERFERIDRHVHDIRNSMHALTILLAKRGVHDEQQ
jgi:hypothetical protein